MLRQGRGRRFGCARGGTTEAWRRGGVDEDEGERGGGGEEEEEGEEDMAVTRRPDSASRLGQLLLVVHSTTWLKFKSYVFLLAFTCVWCL